jgi:hypothetical protein
MDENPLDNLDSRAAPLTGGQQPLVQGGVDSTLARPKTPVSLAPPADTPFKPGWDEKPI